MGSARALALAGTALALAATPYLWLGDGAAVHIHDNLDSTLVWFEVLARSGLTLSFSNDAVVPNALGGLPRNAYPPALNGVTALFHLFGAYGAYLANLILAQWVGSFGMFWLLRRHVLREPEQALPALLVSLAFGLAPIAGTLHLGLATSGLPLVLDAFLSICQRRDRWLHYAGLAAYALYSALVYVGIFLLPLWALAVALLRLRGRSGAGPLARHMLAVAILGLGYVAGELNLLLLFLSGFPSHRSGFSLVGLGLSEDLPGALELALDHFLHGQPHAPTFHAPVVILSCAAALAAQHLRARRGGPVTRPTPAARSARQLAGLLATLAAFAAWFALWRWHPIVVLRERFELLAAIQWDRVYFLSPFLWLLAFALALGILGRGGLLPGALGRRAASALAALQLAVAVWHGDELAENTRRLFGAESATPSFHEFYAPELFQAVAAHIGRPRADYRVASFALYPDIAAFHGFHTIDGYQRLIPRAYHARFRKLIAPELARSDDLRRYFDAWGSRAYLFSAELGKRYLFPAGAHGPVALQVDPAALRGLGAEYLIAAVPLANPTALGLRPLRSFEHERAPYRLHLYGVVRDARPPPPVDRPSPNGVTGSR